MARERCLDFSVLDFMYIQNIVLLAVALVPLVPIIRVCIRKEGRRAVELYSRNAVRTALLAQLLQLPPCIFVPKSYRAVCAAGCKGPPVVERDAIDRENALALALVPWHNVLPVAFKLVTLLFCI